MGLRQISCSFKIQVISGLSQATRTRGPKNPYRQCFPCGTKRKQYLPKLSVRLSTLNMRKDDDLLNLPLYLVDKLKMFVESVELNE